MNDNYYTDWKYVPTYSDDGYTYTWDDILNMVKGNEKLAKVIIDECEYSEYHPETELDQLIKMDEVIEYNGGYELTHDDEFLEKLWSEFSDVLILYNEEYPDGILENDWACFKAGTSKFDIWEWFDERYTNGIHSLMFPNDQKDNKDLISENH